MSNKTIQLQEVSVGATGRTTPIQQEPAPLPLMDFIRSLGSKLNIEQMVEAQLESEVSKIEKDQSDYISFDIPLLIRVFELVREGIKSDVDLHNLVERLLSLKNNGVLTMLDYDAIAGGNTQGTEREGNSITSATFAGDTQHESVDVLKRLAGIR